MRISTPWLGNPHGYFSDWLTQRWVEITGQRIDLSGTERWLDGPFGQTTGIGKHYFQELSKKQGLVVTEGSAYQGLLNSFDALSSGTFNSALVDDAVINFYERTSEYKMDAWAEWSRLMRPFGELVAALFSRRLQQLNLPLSSLDTIQGITSEIVRLADRKSGEIVYTAWLRQLVGTGDVLYAGCYSISQTPRFPYPCVKVVFPLPNGSAVVILKPSNAENNSLSITSAGERFGDPGFYFVVPNSQGNTYARYVRALQETMHVYKSSDGTLRTDHKLRLFGRTFLRIHYRLAK